MVSNRSFHACIEHGLFASYDKQEGHLDVEGIYIAVYGPNGDC